MTFQYFQADTIQEIRNAVYLERGFYVIRDYLSKGQLAHIRNYWLNSSHIQYDGQFDKLRDIYPDCPNASILHSDLDVHHNLFWNEPKDSVTGSVAWHMQSLRNQVDGSPPGREYLPHDTYPGQPSRLRYATSYRVVVTRRGGAVPNHTDWTLDHSRLQMSLILSTCGVDYESGGFVMGGGTDDGPGKLCETGELKAGDLIIFQYAQKHCVDAVTTIQGQTGFIRILMPQEAVDMAHRKESALNENVYSFKNALRLGVRSLRMAGRATLAKCNSSKVPSVPKIDLAKLTRDQVVDPAEPEKYYDEEVGHLMQIAIREGLDPIHVFNHRGLWGRFKEFQSWQFDILKQHGLRPEHSFLDIGCGILRLGMRLVDFLESGNYCGIDPVQEYLDLGQVYMREVLQTDKKYQLVCSESFEFESFGRRFDFVMAQSVLTHLSFVQIKDCFQKLKSVMNPGGKFLFTVILGRDSETPVVSAHDFPMTKSSHSSFAFYDRLAQELGISVQHLGKQGHSTQDTCVAEF